MKKAFLLSAVFLQCAAFGFEVELQDAEGRSVRPEAVGAELRLSRRTDANGVETVNCRLVALSDGVKLLRLTARERFAGATAIWDGRDEKRPRTGRYERPLYRDYTFLMCAAWRDGAGLALGTGAEDGNSDADAIFEGDDVSVSVHAALLRKGAEYACTFHRIAFDPKYGVRDALARYYPLYPRRFYRDPRVSDGIYGVCAQYASWRKADPETCRFMNASWEWCIGAGRNWGDLLSEETPTGKPNADYTWVEKTRYRLRDGRDRTCYSSRMTADAFVAMQDARLASGYYCGIVNGFYTMALANISNKIAARHPDSLVTDHPMAPNDYFYSSEVFTFSECSWGTEVRRQIAALVTRRDIGAMAFDVSRPRSVYRGERLKAMKNVSWDEFGPGVVRGVGSAKLFDFIRTLPNLRLRGNTAVAVNTKYQHLSDLLGIDMTMFESCPWDRDPPFPLAGRYALGEKGLTLWEGYSPREFDPNFDTWTEREQAMLIDDLSHCAVHRSFATGASLPCGFLNGYAARASHAFVRMNDAGWKPVLGAVASDGNWELAHYGLGDRSYLVACNETNAVRTLDLALYPDELETGFVGSGRKAAPVLFAPFFGGKASQRFGAQGDKIRTGVGPQLVAVLEAVGTAEGEGWLTTEWSGEPGRVVLTVSAKKFTGKVRCRESFENYVAEGTREFVLSGGEIATVVYRDAELARIAAAVRKLELKDLRALTVECAADVDSHDIADRIAAFFRSVTLPKDRKKAKKHVSPVKVVENGAMKPLSVRLGPLEVAAADRETLSKLARRTLNVLNELRYPKYGPQNDLERAERKQFSFLRY